MTSQSVVLHETGRMSAQKFAVGFVADLRLPLSPEAFLVEFTSWLTGPHPGAFDLVDEIPSAYRVAALSNMSALHWELIMAMGFPRRFESAYVSYEIGCMKPSPEAFEIALRGIGLPPNQVLFLDDSSVNVEAARALGLNAHLTRNPGEARTVLEACGVLSVPPRGRP
jgi:putative hydrolase of the HAD superfamily